MAAARFSSLVFSAGLLAAALPCAAGASSEGFSREPPVILWSLEEALEARTALTLAAETDPVLFKLLLGAAKAHLERAREEAADAHAVTLNDGALFDVWSFDLQDETRFVDADLVGVLRRLREYGGGPEIRLKLESFLYDRRAGRLLTLEDFFGDLGAESPAMELLRKAVIDRLAPMKAERLRISEAEAREALDSGLPLDSRALRIFSLAPSDAPGAIGGLSFHFGPHEIGAGEEGEYEALLPQEAFRELLLEPWREAFAGAPRDLTRLLSAEGRSGVFYGLRPGATASAPLVVRGEAPRAFFAGGPARLELAPEHGGVVLAKAEALPLEDPPSGAVEEGVVFEARLDGFRAARSGATLNLRLTANPEPTSGLRARAPDQMVLPMVLGPAAGAKTAQEDPGP